MKFFGQDAPHAIAEILILWAVFYAIIRSVHGTRAMQVLQFLIILVLITYLCRMLNLTTVYWLLANAQLPVVVALVILYAPELRRTVSEMTQLRFLDRSRNMEDPMINEASKAALILSRRHIGALIVFERNTNLQGFIDTGIRMDCVISSELLVSVFSPLTPLHDGACMIRNKRLAAAACLLPLSERDGIDSNLGTRHRAALGLAEETDAVVLIVSEETGAVSLAINGKLTRDIDPTRFPSILMNVLTKDSSV